MVARSLRAATPSAKFVAFGLDAHTSRTAPSNVATLPQSLQLSRSGLFLADFNITLNISGDPDFSRVQFLLSYDSASSAGVGQRLSIAGFLTLNLKKHSSDFRNANSRR